MIVAATEFKVASQCPCISVGAPHLDHGVGGMTFDQQQAS